MRQFVFVAFLVAAGCAETAVRNGPAGPQSGTPAVSSDCDVAIDNGIKRLTAGLREYAPDPQTLESGLRTFDRIRGALTRRCVVDGWPPEVAQCFATMEHRADLQACQSRLSAEPSSRLAAELVEATRSPDDSGAATMPPARRRRPSSAHAGAAEAFDMMRAYKVALCDCNDHDQNCGMRATDAYQKAMADWAVRSAGTQVDVSAKPDPEMEALVTEIVGCSRRVMTPDPAAGTANRPGSP